jgi:hypothetical protein
MGPFDASHVIQLKVKGTVPPNRNLLCAKTRILPACSSASKQALITSKFIFRFSEKYDYLFPS